MRSHPPRTQLPYRIVGIHTFSLLHTVVTDLLFAQTSRDHSRLKLNRAEFGGGLKRHGSGVIRSAAANSPGYPPNAATCAATPAFSKADSAQLAQLETWPNVFGGRVENP